MPRLLRLWITVLLSSFLLFTANAITAQDAIEKARELNELRARIQSLQQKLEANERKKSHAEKRLHDIENQISESSRALRRIDNELDAKRRQLQALREKQRGQTTQLKRQREHLASEVRTAYAMGHQQQVKLLLNQEQPSAVGRMLVYFGYFSRARLQRIGAMRASLEQLHALEESIAQKTASLTILRSSQQLESQRLRERKQTRKQAVAALSRELKNQGGKLRRLKTNEQQLQELVSSLQELLVDIPADATRAQPFSTLKGKLRWPTRGRLAKRFGARRGSGGLTWRGVMIEAAEGGDVRAVSQGRVAFSDWMRGFGLLVIIDHGDGYMSLYGHNQALYKEVGEWVDSGEVVALLGASGGQTASGLYFELRHKGQPINPVRWCAGKPAANAG
ncbi:MAG: peptidoglycan DD-metalloendopeptidase family protein [Thiogranum sp.]